MKTEPFNREEDAEFNVGTGPGSVAVMERIDTTEQEWGSDDPVIPNTFVDADHR